MNQNRDWQFTSYIKKNKILQTIPVCLPFCKLNVPNLKTPVCNAQLGATTRKRNWLLTLKNIVKITATRLIFPVNNQIGIVVIEIYLSTQELMFIMKIEDCAKKYVILGYYFTFAMEVKISAKKKSGNVIGCTKKRTIICKTKLSAL